MSEIREVGITPKCSRQEADELWSQIVRAATAGKLTKQQLNHQMLMHDIVNGALANLNNGQRATIIEMIRLDMVAQLEESAASQPAPRIAAADKLAKMRLEARLDEAIWWHTRFANVENYGCCKRISDYKAALAAALDEEEGRG